MKTKSEIVENWLPRYTGTVVEGLGRYILLTNFSNYVEKFAAWHDVDVEGRDRPMPNATAEGISIINFGMGSANAATVLDLLSAVRPKACLFLGKCGGLKRKNELGDLIPAYCVTVHRAQGSEARAVLIVLGGQHHVMLRRNLLYTAVTRGRELVVVVASHHALRRAVANAEEGRAAVTEAAAAGYDLIKTYHIIDTQTRNAVIARATGIPSSVAGHLPPGMPFREAIAKHVSGTRGLEISPDRVVVTPGAKPPICFSLETFVDPGDEVIYPSPGFPIYESWVTFVGAKPVPIVGRLTCAVRPAPSTGAATYPWLKVFSSNWNELILI